jgi:outer membrane protein, heavy metal efflux system
MVDQFLAEVLTVNPGIEAARLDWEAMTEMPEVVASLPDPMVSYGYYFTSVQTRTGAMRQRFGVSQKIPFPGKLGTAKARSAADAQVAYWRFRAALRDVFAQGRTLLADLYRADGAILVLRDQESLLRQTADSAKGLVESNQGSLANVIRSEVAAEEIAVRIAQIEAERTGVIARMGALRGEVEPSTAVPRYADPKLPKLPSLAAVMRRSLTANQDVEAARAAVARDDLGIRAAALEYFPDITLGVDYSLVDNSTVLPMTPQNGEDPFLGTVSFNVPIWWDKLGAQKRAAVARRGSSASRQAQLTADVSANVQSAYAMARAMREQRDRFASEIIPGARQAYESTSSAYRTGATSLTDLLDVQQALLGAELGLIDRTSGYLRAVADLERAIGEPLDQQISQTTNALTKP